MTKFLVQRPQYQLLSTIMEEFIGGCLIEHLKLKYFLLLQWNHYSQHLDKI